MKRIAILLLVALAAVAAAVLLVPRFYSGESLRAGLEKRAMEITGRQIEFAGDPEVIFDPFLAIEIREVVFRDRLSGEETPPILAMPKLRARLSIASALTGSVEFNEFQFVRPTFNLRVREDGRTSWAFPEGQVWRLFEEARQLREATPAGEAPSLAGLTNIAIGSFDVIDGMVTYESAVTGNKETISSFNGKLVWPSTRQAWRFQGSGVWRGDVLNVSTSAEQPIMLLSGGESTLTAEIRSEPVNATFAGKANRLAGLFAQGRLSVSSPSLRRLLNLLGGNLAAGSSLSGFSAEGMLTGRQAQFQIADAIIRLDGNQGSGALSYSITEDGKHMLSGTMAYQDFDVRPYLVSVLANNAQEPEGLTLLDLFSHLLADIRVSAQTVQMGGLNLREFAGSLGTKNGGMVIDIGNAMLQEGNVVGTLQARRNGGEMELATNLSVDPVSPANIAILDGLSAIRPSGGGRVRMKLTTAGNTAADLAARLGGEFSFTMEEGRLQGLDFQSLANALATSPQAPEGSPQDIPIGNGSGATTVRDLTIQASINRGVGWVRDSGFVSGSLQARLNGKVDLRLGSLALWGSLADIPREDAPVANAPMRRFFIGGTLRQPLFVPESFGRTNTGQENRPAPQTTQGTPGGTSTPEPAPATAGTN